MSQRYVYVGIEGSLWRMTRTAWIRYCNLSAVKGSCEDPTHFGVCIQNNLNEVVDWNTEDFSRAISVAKGCVS